MTDQGNRCFQPELFERWAELTLELRALEGKDDEQSHALREELLDELMGVDMALQPSRRAMGQAKKAE